MLLEIPRLLRDVLEHAIHQDGACELLRAPAAEATPSDRVPPDMVILGLTDAEDVTLVQALLARWPGARILTVMPGGATAALYELRRHRRQLDEMSPSELVRTLRDAVQHRHGAWSSQHEDDDAWAV